MWRVRAMRRAGSVAEAHFVARALMRGVMQSNLPCLAKWLDARACQVLTPGWHAEMATRTWGLAKNTAARSRCLLLAARAGVVDQHAAVCVLPPLVLRPEGQAVFVARKHASRSKRGGAGLVAPHLGVTGQRELFVKGDRHPLNNGHSAVRGSVFRTMVDFDPTQDGLVIPERGDCGKLPARAGLSGRQRQGIAPDQHRARSRHHHASLNVAHQHLLGGKHRDLPPAEAERNVCTQVHRTAQLSDPGGGDGEELTERALLVAHRIPVAEHRSAVREPVNVRLWPGVWDVRHDQGVVAVAEGAVDVRHEATADLVVLVPLERPVVAHDHTVFLHRSHELRFRAAREEVHGRPIGERPALSDDNLAPAISAKLERLVVAKALGCDPATEGTGHWRALAQLPASLRNHEALVAHDQLAGVLDSAHQHAAPAEPHDAVNGADDDLPRELEPRRRLEAGVCGQGGEACVRQAQACLGKGLAIDADCPVARWQQLACGGARRRRIGDGEVRHVCGQVRHGQVLARAQQCLALGAREGRRPGLDDGEVAPAPHERHGLCLPARLDPAHPLDDACIVVSLPRVARLVQLAGGRHEGPERAECLVVAVLLGLAHLDLALVGGRGVEALAVRLARAGQSRGTLLQALDEGSQGAGGGVVCQAAGGVARHPGKQGVGLAASAVLRRAEVCSGALAGSKLPRGGCGNTVGAAGRVGIGHLPLALHDALELVVDLRLVLCEVLAHARGEALVDGVQEPLDELGLCVLARAHGLVCLRRPCQVGHREALRVQQQAL
mmetsp:Transcript_59772/g.160169  ORF Transcript_59772/g.160169 Transcript_59772/m.160169 type:complete len:782 (-) Transcript_59772:189-2534(-)